MNPYPTKIPRTNFYSDSFSPKTRKKKEKKRSNKRVITSMNSVNVYYDNRTIKRIVQASMRHSARIYGLANAIQKRLRLPVIHFRHGVSLQLLKRERKTRKNERNDEGREDDFAEESFY